ncbi:MAG: hypothetical protein DWQ36_01775 [Acidobacteria bacterium]|nr:MAG: hypothetical protein DWQ30_16620 [Acidobacteriota bacterium]REK11500.1 MAG: hypothetical protein DWQ36_01775 [Acidobacteriota bacterium]
MSETLPLFRYHPDPISSGSLEPSSGACACCGRARGWLYTGPVFSADEQHGSVCPWCIADGSAHRDLGLEFADPAGVGGYGLWPSVAEEIVACVVQRTPCFSGWQQERWLTCCGEAAAFIGRAGQRELLAHGSEAIESIRAESGMSGTDWRDYLAALDADGSPTAYLFRCLHCGRVGGYSDCD